MKHPCCASHVRHPCPPPPTPLRGVAETRVFERHSAESFWSLGRAVPQQLVPVTFPEDERAPMLHGNSCQRNSPPRKNRLFTDMSCFRQAWCFYAKRGGGELHATLQPRPSPGREAPTTRCSEHCFRAPPTSMCEKAYSGNARGCCAGETSRAKLTKSGWTLELQSALFDRLHCAVMFNKRDLVLPFKPLDKNWQIKRLAFVISDKTNNSRADSMVAFTSGVEICASGSTCTWA